ncbi:hypothetical protein G6F68_010740 [Rhizopus microsporus]|nr:hypothetical protein G6F68_010740 [Rhizopus microsporus]
MNETLTHITIIVVPRRPTIHMLTDTLTNPTSGIELCISVPDRTFRIKTLCDKDLDKISLLALFHSHSDHILVDTQSVVIEITNKISVPILFGDGSKEGNDVFCISKVSVTTRVDKPLSPEC